MFYNKIVDFCDHEVCNNVIFARRNVGNYRYGFLNVILINKTDNKILLGKQNYHTHNYGCCSISMPQQGFGCYLKHAMIAIEKNYGIKITDWDHFNTIFKNTSGNVRYIMNDVKYRQGEKVPTFIGILPIDIKEINLMLSPYKDVKIDNPKNISEVDLFDKSTFEADEKIYEKFCSSTVTSIKKIIFDGLF